MILINTNNGLSWISYTDIARAIEGCKFFDRLGIAYHIEFW